MKSLGLAGAVVAVALVSSAVVVAQTDPLASRKALMKQNDSGAKVVVAMMRGQAPFDAARVDAVFSQWAETAQKLPALFPSGSDKGDTRASPKIWQNKADFDTKAAEFGKAVAENHDKAKQSVEGLKAAVSAVGQACDNCHKDYRLSRR
jgi:cytochrome c556